MPRRATRRRRRHHLGGRDLRQRDRDHAVPGLHDTIGVGARAQVTHRVGEAAVDPLAHRHPGAERRRGDQCARNLHRIAILQPTGATMSGGATVRWFYARLPSLPGSSGGGLRPGPRLRHLRRLGTRPRDHALPRPGRGDHRDRHGRERHPVHANGHRQVARRRGRPLRRRWRRATAATTPHRSRRWCPRSSSPWSTCSAPRTSAWSPATPRSTRMRRSSAAPAEILANLALREGPTPTSARS